MCLSQGKNYNFVFDLDKFYAWKDSQINTKNEDEHYRNIIC